MGDFLRGPAAGGSREAAGLQSESPAPRRLFSRKEDAHMVASREKSPIRPPREGSQRGRCRCGRKALFVSHAAHAKWHVHTDGEHPLCKRCFRDFVNHLREQRAA